MPFARPPSKGTLRKYGLSTEQWLAILAGQGWVCAVCKRVPPSGRWVTDHFHHQNRTWKKMTAEQRRREVRGIICAFCNSHVVGRFMTLSKAKNVVVYLEGFEARRASAR